MAGGTAFPWAKPVYVQCEAAEHFRHIDRALLLLRRMHRIPRTVKRPFLLVAIKAVRDVLTRMSSTSARRVKRIRWRKAVKERTKDVRHADITLAREEWVEW